VEAVSHGGHDQSSQTTQDYSRVAQGAQWREQGYKVRGQSRAIKTRLNSDSSPLNGARHDLSPGATGEERVFNTHRADLAEQKAEQLQQQVTTLTQHVSFLQAQVECRAEEIGQERRAGEQLRVMLVRLEETNRELAGALVQKALPPAPDPDNSVATPKRAHWWAPWRRG
jgi:hypothetical protein